MQAVSAENEQVSGYARMVCATFGSAHSPEVPICRKLSIFVVVTNGNACERGAIGLSPMNDGPNSRKRALARGACPLESSDVE